MLVGIVKKHMEGAKNSQLDADIWESIAGKLKESFPESHFTGKQCASHWHRKGLNPDKKTIGKKKDWSQEADELLTELQGEYGNKWNQIANTMKKIK
jgi:hypothetical protein